MRSSGIYIILFALAILATSCSSTKGVSSSGGGNSPYPKNMEEFVNRDVDDLMVQKAYIDATRAKILEEYPKAVELFKQVLRLDPYNGGAQYELAVIYFETSQYDACKGYITSAVINDSLSFLANYVRTKRDSEPTASFNQLLKEASEHYVCNKWYMVLQADVYAYLGEYDNASNTFAKLLHDHPTDVDYYFDWAYVNIKAGDFNKALEIYNKAEQYIGVDENLISQKQKLYIQLGKIDEAITEVHKLIDADPTNLRYLQMLAELYQGFDKAPEAIKVYEQMLDIDPTNPYALLNLADIYKYQGDRDKYIYYISKAFKNPDLGIDSKIRVIYPYLMGTIDTDKIEEAFTLAEIIVETHPKEAKGYAVYGDLLYNNDRQDEALIQYKKALELDKSVYEVWQQVFFILSDMEKYQELLQTTNEALELFPNQPIVYFFNGIAQSQLGNDADAIEILNAGKGLVYDNKALKVQFYSSLGDSYNNLEEYTESDKAFEEALKLDKENSYVLNNYSYYLSLRGENLEHAAEMSLLSNQLEPDNSSFQDTYAWILFQQGEYKAALGWIKKAYDNGGKESPVILEHYGDILFKLGKVDDAVSYWKQALDKGSKSDKLSQKIADKKLYE